MSENILKYLPVNSEDQKLGINLVNAGHNLIRAHAHYPFLGHPISYKFNWKTGRVLDEFQINYIQEGYGVFESASGIKKRIKPGSLFMLFPHEWHRYRPDIETGWDEYWVGFKGMYADYLLSSGIIDKKQPVHHLGLTDSVQKIYQDIISEVQEERPNYQVIGVGLLLQLIGHCKQITQQQIFDSNKTADLMKKARLMLSENLQQPYQAEFVSEELGIGYSRFRKIFKQYTGFAPAQYQMQQRILKARQYLISLDLSVKEIAFQLGFDSNSHFSKVFKAKTGYSPSVYRQRNRGVKSD